MSLVPLPVPCIPTGHDAEVREVVATWDVLRRAWPYEWEPSIESSWYRPLDGAKWDPLVATLTAAGLDPRRLMDADHGADQAALRERAARWTREDAAAAFVAGLWSAPGGWRGALIGVLLADAMPEHTLSPWNENLPYLCQVCGVRPGADQVVDEWARRVLETPLDGDPSAAAAQLGWFGDGRPVPTAYDRWVLGAVRAVLASLPAGTRYAKAGAAIDAAKILPARSGGEVLEDLALIGVLAATDHPGLVERFTTYRERDARPNTRVEVQAPLAWWDTSVGDHGVRPELWEAVFGHLDIPVVDLDAPRPAPDPVARDTIVGGLAARVRALTPKAERAAASVGSGPVAAGDVWAMRVRDGAWVTFYVHDVHERGRPYARVEPLTGVFATQPAVDDAHGTVQPRFDGRWVMYAHSVDRTPHTRRIAEGVSVPAGDGEVPERGSWQAAKELRHLLTDLYDEL